MQLPLELVTLISFEELHDKLADHEITSKKSVTKHDATPITAQYTQHRHQSNNRDRNFHGNPKGGMSYQSNNRIGHSNNRSTPYEGRASNNSQPSAQSWNQTQNTRPRIVFQLCDKLGHGAKTCKSHSTPPLPRLILHSPIRGLLQPLIGSLTLVLPTTLHLIFRILISIHSNYGGNDDIVIGYGNSIPITYTGFTQLVTPQTIFQLNNVLCAPQISKNLLSVSQFYNQNNTSIEFFPHCFVVKDLRTGASLAQGLNNGHLY